MPGTVDNKRIYHLGVLIPFWVLQLISELLVIAFAGLGMALLVARRNRQYCFTDYRGYRTCSNYVYYGDEYIGLNYGAYSASLAFASLNLILHIVQIALFGRKKLKPAANFGFELSRFIVWTLVMIVVVIAIGLIGISTSVLNVTFVLLAWLLYMGTMIYASVIFHRSRRGRYNSAHTASYYGGYPPGYGAEQAGHYGPGPYQHPSSQYGPVHGQPVYTPPPHPSQSPVPAAAAPVEMKQNTGADYRA